MEHFKMMELNEREARLRASHIFDGWVETLLWSVLDGSMGHMWVLNDTTIAPCVATCENGDFWFVGGDATSPEAEPLLCAVVCHIGQAYAIIVPQSKEWEPLIETAFGDRAKRGERYAIHKNGDCFDRERLNSFVAALPNEFAIRPIDHELYTHVMKEHWSRDFCAAFGSEERYFANGLGFVVLLGEELMGGASSYGFYQGGIEIEVDTRSDMRRRGIALACCAKMILTCLERGIYPSWDAANRASVALAQKLGYIEKGAYAIFEINES